MVNKTFTLKNKLFNKQSFVSTTANSLIKKKKLTLIDKHENCNTKNTLLLLVKSFTLYYLHPVYCIFKGCICIFYSCNPSVHYLIAKRTIF